MSTLLQIIKSRTRSGWKESARAQAAIVRAWVQLHAERAALITFFLGLFIAVLFKLFIFLVALGILAAYAVWYFAPSGE